MRNRNFAVSIFDRITDVATKDALTKTAYGVKAEPTLKATQRKGFSKAVQVLKTPVITEPKFNEWQRKAANCAPAVDRLDQSRLLRRDTLLRELDAYEKVATDLSMALFNLRNATPEALGRIEPRFFASMATQVAHLAHTIGLRSSNDLARIKRACR